MKVSLLIVGLFLSQTTLAANTYYFECLAKRGAQGAERINIELSSTSNLANVTLADLEYEVSERMVYADESLRLGFSNKGTVTYTPTQKPRMYTFLPLLEVERALLTGGKRLPNDAKGGTIIALYRESNRHPKDVTYRCESAEKP